MSNTFFFFHTYTGVSCQQQCVRSYLNGDTTGRKVSAYRFMCPVRVLFPFDFLGDYTHTHTRTTHTNQVCNVVCSLEKIDKLSNSINLSDYIPIRDASKDSSNQVRTAVFSFPRQIRESEDGSAIVIVNGFTYKLSVSMAIRPPISYAAPMKSSNSSNITTLPSNNKRLWKGSAVVQSNNVDDEKKKKKTKRQKQDNSKESDDDNKKFEPRVFSSKSARVKSDFRGVCWDTRKQKWKSQIGHRGETLYLGHHQREADAALAYDMAARKLHGNRARCNFDHLGFRTKFSGNSSQGSGYKKPKPPPGHVPRTCRTNFGNQQQSVSSSSSSSSSNVGKVVPTEALPSSNVVTTTTTSSSSSSSSSSTSTTASSLKPPVRRKRVSELSK